MADPRPPLRRLCDSLADRFDTGSLAELLAVGEWHVGFEELGDQAYEVDLELTAGELALVDEIAEGWDDPVYRRAARFAAACLRAAGPRGSDGRWRTRVLTVAHFKSDAEACAGLCAALELPRVHAWRELPPASAGVLPHVLELHAWDVLRAAFPEAARALLTWLLACDAVTLVIRDTSEARLDPRAELQRLA